MAFLSMCQGCGAKGDHVTRRELRSKEFKGPCSDSFCYSTCTSPSCRAIECILCPECAAKLTNEGIAALGRSPNVVLENKAPKAPKKKVDSVRAFFRKVEYLGNAGDEVTLVFIVSADDYDLGRSIGNFVCSNVRLVIEGED